MNDAVTKIVTETLFRHLDQMIDLLLDKVDALLEVFTQEHSDRKRGQYLVSYVTNALNDEPDHPLVDMIIEAFHSHAMQARRISMAEQDNAIVLDKRLCYPSYSPGVIHKDGLVRLGPILVAVSAQNDHVLENKRILDGGADLYIMRNAPPGPCINCGEMHFSMYCPRASLTN
jgi:hypothetical protein